MNSNQTAIKTAQPSDDMTWVDFSDDQAQGIEAFKNGMACLGSAVNVITTCVEGQYAGFTATAVTSVSDTPPSLLVCLNRNSSVFETFKNATHLCVNTLSAQQAAISGLFAGKLTQQERFDSVKWQSFLSGSPVIEGSNHAFDCQISERVDSGTHVILICDILGVANHKDTSNLVYFNRQYHELY